MKILALGKGLIKHFGTLFLKNGKNARLHINMDFVQNFLDKDWTQKFSFIMLFTHFCRVK